MLRAVRFPAGGVGMRKDITVAAESRDSRGKNEARRLRVSGKIPAVVYGGAPDSVAISVDPKQLAAVLRSGAGHNTIFTLSVAQGESSPVMIVDWQSDPLRGNLLHADLKRIDLSQRLTVKVPVQATGEAKGVKQQGGVLELVTREVEIECLPDEIPASFTINISELLIGQVIRASDLPLTGSIILLSAADAVLAHVISVRAEAAATTEETAETAAEPEVIKRGKKEEEEAGEDAKKKKK